MANLGRLWRARWKILVTGSVMMALLVAWHMTSERLPRLALEPVPSNYAGTDHFIYDPPNNQAIVLDDPVSDEAVESTQESLFWIEEKREGEEDIVVRLFFKDGELQVEGDLSEGARLFFQMVRPYVDDYIARKQ